MLTVKGRRLLRLSKSDISTKKGSSALRPHTSESYSLAFQPSQGLCLLAKEYTAWNNAGSNLHGNEKGWRHQEGEPGKKFLLPGILLTTKEGGQQ